MIPANEVAARPSVLHIFKVYYPDLFGGTLSVIRDICAGLKDQFNAAILVCSNAGGQKQIVVDDVKVERVHSFGDVLSLPAAPSYPWRLWRRIAEHDLLALHAPFPLADLVFALGLGRNRPLVVHWHADIVTHAGLRRFIEPLMRRTLKRRVRAPACNLPPRCHPPTITTIQIREIAWQIEELRVSLWAQQLGTPRPVSEQRIYRAIDAVG